MVVVLGRLLDKVVLTDGVLLLPDHQLGLHPLLLGLETLALDRELWAFLKVVLKHVLDVVLLYFTNLDNFGLEQLLVFFHACYGLELLKVLSCHFPLPPIRVPILIFGLLNHLEDFLFLLVQSVDFILGLEDLLCLLYLLDNPNVLLHQHHVRLL